MKHRSLVAIAAAGALVLAACGDDDDTAGTDVVVTADDAGAGDTDAGAGDTDAGADTEAADDTEAPDTEAGADTEAGIDTEAADDTTTMGTDAMGSDGAPSTGPVITDTTATSATTMGSDAMGTDAMSTEPMGTDAGTMATDSMTSDSMAADTMAPDTTATDTMAADTTMATDDTMADDTTDTTATDDTVSDDTTDTTDTTATDDTMADDTTATDTTATDDTMATAVTMATADTMAGDTEPTDTMTTDTMGTDTTATDDTTATADTMGTDTTATDDTTATADTMAGDTEPTDTMTTDTMGTDTAGTEGGATGAIGEPTGPACAEVPDDGDGSFEGMADDPAATAAGNNPELSTLVDAVEAADLVDTLNGDGPFTIFAPANSAFDAVPPNVLDSILDDTDLLTTILTYHVVAGEAMSAADLAEAGSAETVQGEELTFELDGDTLMVNGDVSVVCGDITVGNGTVHIIDTVLQPPSATGGSGGSSVPGSSTPGSSTPMVTDDSMTDDSMTDDSMTDDSMTDDSAATDDSATDGSTASETTEGGVTQEAGGITFPVTPGDDWPETLTFTLTPSQEAGGLIESAEPLAEMLAERLGVAIEAIVPTDYAGVIVALQSGQAQIAGGLGPLQMVQAEDEAGADLILQAERFGSFEYVTQWFTNDPDTFCEDEPVADDEGLLFCNGVLDAAETGDASQGPIGEDQLANVEGQTVAFVDQGSASGYLVPALQLLNAGVDPESGIEPLFAGGHDQAVQAVFDGDATVGVSFNDARTELVDQVPDVGEQVVVFAWSFPIPNDGFAVAGDLPEDLKEAITAAFVDIAATPEGAELLDGLYEIEGLQPVDGGDFDVIRELRTELAGLLE